MTWDSFKEIYEHVGRFCVDFEQFCRAMEVCIRNILNTQGLTNESIQTILMAGSTASPLRTLLQNLTGEVLGTNENKALLSKAFSKLQTLIEERNDLIHSKWFVYGRKTEEDIAKFLAYGEKLHANKDGEAIKNFNLEKEKVETLIKKCREASIIISLLTRCVIGLRKIEDCFSIDNKKLVINYEALKPDKITYNEWVKRE